MYRIINNSNPYEYLVTYLKGLGVSNGEYWAYNILNDNFPIFRSSDVLGYKEDNFDSDLKIILRKRYK